MSQFVVSPTKTFRASGALGIHLRVKLNGSNLLELAGTSTGETEVGTLREAALAAQQLVAVILPTAQGTQKMVAAGAFDQEALVYGAASGTVDDVVNGKPIGYALEAATQAGDVVEVMRINATVIVEAATALDDVDITWGTGSDTVSRWSTADGANNTFVIGLDNTSQQLHVTDKAAVATNFNVGADTHPTVYIHSNTTPITDYVKIGTHNGTSAWLGDVVGGGTAFIGFDGLECLELTETATAVNHIGIVNAQTGDNPIIRAEGESDTGLTFDNEAGEEILILNSVATSVNEITIASAATGDNPTIACTGESDTGITFQNAGAEEILILDSIASSVNEITVASAATGGAPSITASGDDTHVSLELSAQGTTGVVQVTDPLVEKMTLAAAADSATITIAQLLTKILDATPTAAATYTLPTAADLVAGITDCKVGDGFSFYINNKGGAGDDITVAGGAGSTDDGILVTADGEMRQYLIVVTNVTGAAEAYLTYGIGTPAS